MDARRAVAATAGAVHLRDACRQLRVREFVLARGVLMPLVVGGRGDSQQSAGPADGDFFRLDEAIALHRISLAKKAAAFLRISLSFSKDRIRLRCSTIVSWSAGDSLSC